MRLQNIFIFFILSGIIAALIGCAGSGRVQFQTPEQAFQRGLELYERESYQRASEHFQAVFDFGRTHEVAAEAQLYLARSYFNNRDYLLAANEYTRFLEFYRTDPRVADAEYERALSYYRLSPPYQLDQTDTERAITFLQLFITRYATHNSTIGGP
jgi:outer membrane protein assembly factor BamD